MQVSESFNSRPLEEVDRTIWLERGWMSNVSIHDLSKRSTTNGLEKSTPQLEFQFTTSRRGRPTAATTASLIAEVSIHDLSKRSTADVLAENANRTFQFTTSRRGRPALDQGAERTIYRFNSRPLEEVDRWMIPHLRRRHRFNSRPLEEVDRFSKRHYRFRQRVSIHDLSKRSTVLARNLFRNT